MSTILKALRRLEEQKSSRTAERPLREEVVLAPKRSSAREGLARVALAAVVVALAAAALLFGLRREPVPAEPEVASVPALPEVAAAPPAETRITVAASGRATPNTVVPVPPAPPDFEIVRPNPTAPARMLAPRPLPTIAEEEVLAEVPTRTGIRVLPRTPPEEYDEEPLEAAPAPRVAARAASPIRVARTLWHPSPDRRLAWVEVEGQTALREVREGERVGPYVVREIEPAAVLFAEGSVELRREVGP